MCLLPPLESPLPAKSSCSSPIFAAFGVTSCAPWRAAASLGWRVFGMAAVLSDFLCCDDADAVRKQATVVQKEATVVQTLELVDHVLRAVVDEAAAKESDSSVSVLSELTAAVSVCGEENKWQGQGEGGCSVLFLFFLFFPPLWTSVSFSYLFLLSGRALFYFFLLSLTLLFFLSFLSSLSFVLFLSLFSYLLSFVFLSFLSSLLRDVICVFVPLSSVA